MSTSVAGVIPGLTAEESAELRKLEGVLEPRQWAFCEHYLVTLDPTTAALEAGYAERGARQTAHRLMMRNPHVGRAIVLMKKRRSHRVALAAERVLKELGCLATSDIGEVFDFSGEQQVALRPPKDIPTRARRAIQSIKIKRFAELLPAFVFDKDGKIELDKDGRMKVETRAVTGEILELKMYDKIAPLRAAMAHLGIDKAPEDRGEESRGILIALDC